MEGRGERGRESVCEGTDVRGSKRKEGRNLKEKKRRQESKRRKGRIGMDRK